MCVAPVVSSHRPRVAALVFPFARGWSYLAAVLTDWHGEPRFPTPLAQHPFFLQRKNIFFAFLVACLPYVVVGGRLRPFNANRVVFFNLFSAQYDGRKREWVD